MGRIFCQIGSRLLQYWQQLSSANNTKGQNCCLWLGTEVKPSLRMTLAILLSPTTDSNQNNQASISSVFYSLVPTKLVWCARLGWTLDLQFLNGTLTRNQTACSKYNWSNHCMYAENEWSFWWKLASWEVGCGTNYLMRVMRKGQMYTGNHMAGKLKQKAECCTSWKRSFIMMRLESKP